MSLRGRRVCPRGSVGVHGSCAEVRVVLLPSGDWERLRVASRDPRGSLLEVQNEEQLHTEDHRPCDPCSVVIARHRPPFPNKRKHQLKPPPPRFSPPYSGFAVPVIHQLILEIIVLIIMLILIVSLFLNFNRDIVTRELRHSTALFYDY